jgi:Fuc2NAc and GlcNAc transferase
MSSRVLIASFLSTTLLVAVARAIAVRVGMIDMPNRRSSHTLPTPRGGGVSIVLTVLATVVLSIRSGQMPLLAGATWMIGGAIVSGAGLIDDFRGLRVAVRIGLQLIAAVLLVATSVALSSLPLLTGPIDLGYGAWIVGIVMAVWSINLFNFMDGIDGLAAAQGLFVTAATALLVLWTGGQPQWPLLALAGACAAFLLWNAPPAKVFMGDVGSSFIGFCLSALAFLPQPHPGNTVWTWLVLNSLFFVDATITLMSRLVRGERVYEAHRSHIYQQLSRRWRSHGAVTLIYSTINVLWCLPWALETMRAPQRGPLFAGVELVPLIVVATIMGAGKPEWGAEATPIVK